MADFKIGRGAEAKPGGSKSHHTGTLAARCRISLHGAADCCRIIAPDAPLSISASGA